MSHLKLLSTLTLVGTLLNATANELPVFADNVLNIPVVNTTKQIGQYEHVQFQLAKDGRWDLITATESRQGTIESIIIDKLESFPVQVQVTATGYFSNGCLSLGDTHIVFNKNQFNIVINSTTLQTTKLITCTAALVPFKVTIPLNVNGLNAGTYQVDVNGITDAFELSTDNFHDATE